MVTENGLQLDGTTSFLRAARSGNIAKVLEHLKNNIDINTSNANGLNALHLAAKDGHIPVVSELLKRGANVDNSTKKGNTALHIASLAGQEEVVNLLLQHGASVNAQSQNGFTPLYMAAQENHDSVVKLLLGNGANQSLATEDGFTPLAVAMQQGHDKVVAVLLESDTRGRVRLPALHIAAKKDDVKAASLLLENDHNPDVTSKSGFTPLHIASHYGNECIATLLIQSGADVNFPAKHNICPLHVTAKWGKTNMVSLLLEKGANIESRTRDGLTPLHCAARSGHEQVVDMLLERGAPISAKTKNGLAPLHMAAQGEHVDAARILLYHRAPVDEVTVDYLTALHVAAHCGHVRVAKLLLDRNADANARALNGFTPLHIACKKNRIKVVELLLKHGASISATTESGLTPLHVASFMGSMNIVIFLLQHDASPDIPTVRGETPLHLAARANQTDIIRILLRNGAQVDARAREQQTPLHIASRLSNVDIVMLLLQHGAQVDATTKDMYTALHIAAKEGQDEVATVLIDNGACLDSTTKKGFTPLHLAAKYGHIKVVELLLQKATPIDAQGKNGVTPLHVACHYDHQNIALTLLSLGANPLAIAKNGYTPLHIAARKNQMDIATSLIEYGADSDCESKAGFTPLHLSAHEGNVEISSLLIEHKANANHPARNGLTPLHLCAQEDKTNVAKILVFHEADIEAKTKAGFTPLHIAAHFGQTNMVRYLQEQGADINSQTSINYTPLHQAAQQGHCHIVKILIEKNADPNALTASHQTPLNIAQKLGYISVYETLKDVTNNKVITSSQSHPSEIEKYRVFAPESMHETFMSDSDEEGGDDNITDQPYRYLTVDEMKSLGDDSLPIDVTRDERVDSNRMVTSTGSNVLPPTALEDISPFHIKIDNIGTDLTNLNYLHENVNKNKKIHCESFLVSFLVDARGGAMRGCRHSGIRLIVPSKSACQPTRITCRYVKPHRILHPPQLMEGEALASRVLELGPIGTKFIGPILLEIPHFASLRGKEREIVVLRSDNGETWREHSIENSDEIIHDIMNDCLESENGYQLDDFGDRVCRFITYDLPQYFSVVSRIRQEVHAIGPDGGMVSSTVVPQVQAVFPQGALTKKIKVGLQAQPIDPDLTAKLLGRGVAVSPVVTVEPRRRKFHKAITLSIPAPKAHSQGMINQYSGSAPTLRLLCSITGGSSRAQWEDVTGSTPLTFVNDCVSFTTTVSARFWLMDCRNITDATKMATDLYREAIHVPFMAKFVVFAKRTDIMEAQLRVFCMTDDKEDKTLERNEYFTEVARSRDVEVLERKSQFTEISGNLVPIAKSGEQLQFPFKAFRENRLSINVRIKDQHADIVGRTLFMREPKVPKGEPPQQPICILNIILPEQIIYGNTGTDFEDKQSSRELNQLKKELSETNNYLGDLRIVDISNLLGKDWIRLATYLKISNEEISYIESQNQNSTAHQAQSMITKFLTHKQNKRIFLENALRAIQREDIILKCMKNIQTSSLLDSPGIIKANMTLDDIYNNRDIMKDSESIEDLNIQEDNNLQIFHETEELKYSAEEKIIEDSQSEDDEHDQKTVARRREQIQKRLSIGRLIPASSQKREIDQEITEIKRNSLLENTKALHEDIIMHAATDNNTNLKLKSINLKLNNSEYEQLCNDSANRIKYSDKISGDHVEELHIPLETVSQNFGYETFTEMVQNRSKREHKLCAEEGLQIIAKLNNRDVETCRDTASETMSGILKENKILIDNNKLLNDHEFEKELKIICNVTSAEADNLNLDQLLLSDEKHQTNSLIGKSTPTELECETIDRAVTNSEGEKMSKNLQNSEKLIEQVHRDTTHLSQTINATILENSMNDTDLQQPITITDTPVANLSSTSENAYINQCIDIPDFPNISIPYLSSNLEHNDGISVKDTSECMIENKLETSPVCNTETIARIIALDPVFEQSNQCPAIKIDKINLRNPNDQLLSLKYSEPNNILEELNNVEETLKETKKSTKEDMKFTDIETKTSNEEILAYGLGNESVENAVGLDQSDQICDTKQVEAEQNNIPIDNLNMVTNFKSKIDDEKVVKCEEITESSIDNFEINHVTVSDIINDKLCENEIKICNPSELILQIEPFHTSQQIYSKDRQLAVDSNLSETRIKLKIPDVSNEPTNYTSEFEESITHTSRIRDNIESPQSINEFLVEKTIAEVKKSLEAVQDDLIEVVINGQLIKQSPSEFEFKMMPFIRSEPTLEPHKEEISSHSAELEMNISTTTEKQKVSQTNEIFVQEEETVSFNHEDSSNKSETSLPIKISSNKWLSTDPDNCSSSSHYDSFDRTDSRPCSSDVENLLLSGNCSEFFSARDASIVPGSTEYHTAANTLDNSKKTISSHESMKSFDSESLEHITSTSDPSETLIPSTSDLDISLNIRDNILDETDVLYEGGNSENISVEQDISQVNLPMKRSHEMLFNYNPDFVTQGIEIQAIKNTESEDCKLATSLEDGSILSVSLSSISNAPTVVENIKASEDIEGSLSSSMSEVLSLHKDGITGTSFENMTLTDATEYITIKNSYIREDDSSTSVNTQIITTKSIDDEYGNLAHNTKNIRIHKRSDSTGFIRNLEIIPVMPELLLNQEDRICDKDIEYKERNVCDDNFQTDYSTSDKPPPVNEIKQLLKIDNEENITTDQTEIEQSDQIKAINLKKKSDRERKLLEKDHHLTEKLIREVNFALECEVKITEEQYEELIEQQYQITLPEQKESNSNEESDRASSPNSDSFEIVDQPDVNDEFVVIEEVAKEANESDLEGKSLTIKNVKFVKKHDDEVETLLVKSAPAATDEGSNIDLYRHGMGFEFEESPPDINTRISSENKSGETSGLEASRKWVEIQLGEQAQVLRYPYEIERGILEDIKEEDTDAEVGSSRISSFKDSYSSTPDYDIQAGRKFFLKEHDNTSMSSLQEFESLEQAISLESKRFHPESQDSSSNGSLPKRYVVKNVHGDDISLSSLKEFEGLENACIEAQLNEIRAKEEAAILLSRSDESNKSDSYPCTAIKNNVNTAIEICNENNILLQHDVIKSPLSNRGIIKDNLSLKAFVGENEDLDSNIQQKSFAIRDISHHCSSDSLEISKGNDVMTSSIDSIEISKDGRSTDIDSLEQGDNENYHRDSFDSIEVNVALIPKDSLSYKNQATTPKNSEPDTFTLEALPIIPVNNNRENIQEFNISKDNSDDSLNNARYDSDILITSTESLDPTTSATNATYQNENETIMSGSITSFGSNTMIDVIANIEIVPTGSNSSNDNKQNDKNSSTICIYPKATETIYEDTAVPDITM